MTRRPMPHRPRSHQHSLTLAVTATALSLWAGISPAEPARAQPVAMVAPENVPSAAARAVAALIDELTRVAGEVSGLAADLQSLNADLETVSSDMAARLAAVEQSADDDLEALRTDLAGQIAELDTRAAAAREAIAGKEAALAASVAEADRQLTELAAQIKAVEATTDTLKAADASTDEAVADGARRVEAVEAGLAELKTGLASATAALARIGTDPVARAAALVLAAERALGEGDVGSARTLLERADRVAARDDALAAALGPALSDALGALSDVASEDEAVTAASAAVAGHCAAVSALPVRPAESPGAPMASIRDAEPQAPSGWRSVLSGLWRDLIGQVKVTPISEYEARVGGGELKFAQVSLAGMCLRLEDSLAARDAADARRLVPAMQTIIDATFDPSAASVVAFKGALSTVQALEIAPHPSLVALDRALDRALIGAPAPAPASSD